MGQKKRNQNLTIFAINRNIVSTVEYTVNNFAVSPNVANEIILTSKTIKTRAGKKSIYILKMQIRS